MENFDLSPIKVFLTTTGVNILIAILVLYLGLKVANFITNRIAKTMDKKEVDPS